MKFTVSTKPLVEGLNLGILDANVSKFYERSTMVQIRASREAGLVINIEAAQIKSKLEFKGACEGEGEAIVFVDSLLFKKLVSTFEASTTTLELLEDSLVLYSGKSKFSLPKVVDADLRLPEPASAEDGATEIKKDAWRFIKDYQLYALGMSFIAPVYTKVWVGESGDVLAGDFQLNLFTHSSKGTLGRTCLLTDTIINLFNALPDGAKLYPLEKTFVIKYVGDSFSYTTEFEPKHESDPDMGSYRTDLIMPMLASNESGYTVKVVAIQKILSQADLLSTSTEETVSLISENNQLKLVGEHVNAELETTGTSADYELPFKIVDLKSIMSNCSEESIIIRPAYNIDGDDKRLVGINVDSNALKVVISAAEDEE